ncbi:MAG: hypothetical protein CM15mP42_04880 [Methanobacteriota archaeon]|nr:MAG: hypothetical protein CM15mP42_04880 [Euryarchaeota archaeon]
MVNQTTMRSEGPKVLQYAKKENKEKPNKNWWGDEVS